MITNHPHAGHPWHPGAGIEARLAELAALYSASILLELDNEGRAFLEAALKDRTGEILWTDNGGGELSDKHWEIAVNHVGFAEVILWFEVPEDAGLVRAACSQVERMGRGDGSQP